ncbi:MAG: hypothetical protein KKH29_06190 [Candidatus Omnitrophica bacterium]|nr:hypothetical protein [Candidatus Omnitrophota bacterium]
MAYQATVYTLMISCPFDAEDEQRTLRGHINRWNDVHSERTSIVLLPSFYKTHVPAILAGPDDERPQAVINEYMIKSSDWLIAVFKDRIGTPTGRAESGTLEEIEIFRRDNIQKPVSVYFFAKSQDDKITEYKEKLTGIWKEYNDCPDLGQEFFVNLSQVVHKNTYLRQKFIDTTRKTEERAQVLLSEVASDAKKIVIVSRLVGAELRLETNGCKYAGYETAFELLCRKRHLEKLDSKGDIFRLSELGMQEIEVLKNFSAF